MSPFRTGQAGTPAGALVPFACIRGLRDAAAVEAAYHVCATLTPRIERHADALVLDLGGSERLVLAAAADADSAVGWPALAQSLSKRLQADVRGMQRVVRVGIGPTRTVAWLAATSDEEPWQAVLPEQVAGFLAPLPLALLGGVPDLAHLPEKAPALDVLALSGIRTFGHLRRLTPVTLQRRFGPFGASIAAVAAGHDLTPLRVERLDEWTGIRLRCDPALRTEQLPAALAPLAEHTMLTLMERQQATGAVALILYPEVGEPVHAARELSHPVASASALLDQARRLLEVLVRPPTGSVEAATYSGVRLRVGRLQLATAEQRQLWSNGTDRAADDRQTRRRAALRALARMGGVGAGMGGEAALYRAVLQQLDAVLPEERYILEPLHPAR
jgi:nucleotidyltransferase/DNA polymerase involved in DNA repair